MDDRLAVAKPSRALSGDLNCAASLLLPGVGESAAAYCPRLDETDMVCRRGSRSSSAIGSRNVCLEADEGTPRPPPDVDTLAPSNGLDVAGRLGEACSAPPR